jgi:hypothetical protein
VVVTIAFGAIVAQADRHGALGKAAAQIASIPNTLAGVYHGLFPNRPKLVLDYVPEPGGLHYAAGQSFVDPGYVLLTEFSNARQQRVIRLMRLSDGKCCANTRRTCAPCCKGPRSDRPSSTCNATRPSGSTCRCIPCSPMMAG